MTKSTDELKGYFKDGAVPSGENFASLIDSMVHVDRFEQWTEQGQVSLGAEQSKWQLRVDKDESLVVERSPKDEPSAAEDSTPPNVRMPAWVAMEGRIGTYNPTVAVPKPSASGLNTASMQSVKADGNWHHIIDVPDRCYAFEIVAQMSGKPTTAPGILQTLRRLSGLKWPQRAITHAIVTTSASGSRASIRETADPDASREWRRLSRWVLAIVLLLLVVMLPLSLFPYTSALGDDFFKNSKVKRTFVVDGISGVVVPILRTYEVVIGMIREPCELRLEKTSPGKTKDQTKKEIDAIVGSFKTDLEKKKKECAVLVVHPANDPETWTVAGFNGEGDFCDRGNFCKIANADSKHELSEELKQELSEELKEKRRDLSQIAKLATSILGRPLRDNTAIVWVIGFVFLLYLVIRALSAIYIHRSAVRLAWRKSGGSVLKGTAAYALYLRGGHYPTDTSVKVHYHVTRLWG